MATVYLARDVRHDRAVAVKVLKPELGAVVGTERFLAEIAVTASLQHPHILPLFDSGEATVAGYSPGTGSLYYVMPYVEGETLRARLDRERQLPIDEAIRIASRIASALDYAHRRGIIHRDLKPENVLLHEGEPLVADFGIALALSKAGGDRITQTGISLGTPQYMSPEQASGDRQLDARSDVYSLAAVLYEMLGGEPPHSGPTVQAVLSRVLAEAPRPIDQLRPATPRHLGVAIDIALAKFPADRFASAGEFIEALRHPDASMASPTARRATATSHWKWVAGGLVGGAIVGLGITNVGRSDVGNAKTAGMRGTINLPADAPLAVGGTVPTIGYSSPVLAISADGSWLAWIARTSAAQMIYVRDMATGETRALAGTEGAIHAFFSPDAQWIGFLTATHVNKIPRAGGAVTRLTEARTPIQAWWATPDAIYFTEVEATRLSRVGANGESPQRLLSGLGIRSYDQVLDGGRYALATRMASISGDQGQIVVVDMERRSVRSVGIAGYGARFVAPDQLLFARSGAVYAVPFDLEAGAPVGEPEQVVAGVMMESLFHMLHAAQSSNGVLAFIPGIDLSRGRLAWVDRMGAVEFVSGAPERVFGPIDLSPDESRIAVHVSDAADYIWVWDIRRREGRRAPFSGGEGSPRWGSNGTTLLGVTIGVGDTMIPIVHDVDGSGGIAEGVNIAGVDGAPASISGRSDTFALHNFRRQEIEFADRRGRLELTPIKGFLPVSSPDGRWLAHGSDIDGAVNVWITSFPAGKAVGQVSTEGGLEPVWLRTGELFYRRGGTWWMATVSGGANLTWTRPRQVFETDFIDTPGFSYDVTNDGRRLLVVKRAQPIQRDRIEFITNWPSLLRQRQR